ncbi:transposase [Candidatus Bathyarchaeota archaeon]|nr:transposase [Candidatus Bathyarchaeota archaeon]
MCYDAFPVEAWSRRDPENPSIGLSDPEARVGRGRRRAFFLGYKTHCGGDWNSEMPTAYLVRPANENEKRHFKDVASKVKERFPNARWHVADNQYSSKRLRKYIEEELKGRPVIPKRRDEKRGAGDFYVDRSFRCRGNRRMCGLYGRRTASERVNSRAERLVGRNTLRGVGRVGGYVGVALTLMLLVTAASYRRGRPELARSIEYYASH